GTSAAVARSIGSPQVDHLHYSVAYLKGLSENLRFLLHTPTGAKQIVLAVLLEGGSADLHKSQELTQEGRQRALRLKAELQSAERGSWLQLVQLAIPALRQLPRGERQLFLDSVKALIVADHRLSILEFCIHALLTKYLLPSPPPFRRALTLQGCEKGVLALLA